MREDRNCQWRVAARPEGNVRPSDFEYREEAIPEPIREELVMLGHEVQVRDIGNANGLAIEYMEDGTVRFTGASDPRGSGLAKGV